MNYGVVRASQPSRWAATLGDVYASAHPGVGRSVKISSTLSSWGSNLRLIIAFFFLQHLHLKISLKWEWVHDPPPPPFSVHHPSPSANFIVLNCWIERKRVDRGPPLWSFWCNFSLCPNYNWTAIKELKALPGFDDDDDDNSNETTTTLTTPSEITSCSRGTQKFLRKRRNSNWTSNRRRLESVDFVTEGRKI